MKVEWLPSDRAPVENDKWKEGFGYNRGKYSTTIKLIFHVASFNHSITTMGVILSCHLISDKVQNLINIAGDVRVEPATQREAIADSTPKNFDRLQRMYNLVDDDVNKYRSKKAIMIESNKILAS